MSTLKLVKNGRVSVFPTTSSIHSMSFILIEFEEQGKKSGKEQRKKTKKQRNEEPWILAYTLVL
jgi:hypothetical protein